MESSSFSSGGLLWTTAVLAVLFCAVVALFGQAAYMRSRLNAIEKVSLARGQALQSQGQESQAPAIRAYSVKVNVAATRALSSWTALVKDASLESQCGSPQTGRLLVIRGSSRSTSGPMLHRDVSTGQVRYFLIQQATYMVWTLGDSKNELAVRSSPGMSGAVLADDDLILVIQLLQQCPAATIRPPVMSSTLSSGDPLKEVQQERVHGWGYGSGVVPSAEVTLYSSQQQQQRQQRIIAGQPGRPR